MSEKDEQSAVFAGFTEKAKKALESAKALAERLGDQSVATGHLIYGLSLDQSVSVHHILRDLNVDPDMFAEYVGSLPREPEAHRGE